jgi:hypothetical protein
MVRRRSGQRRIKEARTCGDLSLHKEKIAAPVITARRQLLPTPSSSLRRYCGGLI